MLSRREATRPNPHGKITLAYVFLYTFRLIIHKFLLNLKGKNIFEDLRIDVENIIMGLKETERCGHRLTSFETGLERGRFVHGTEQAAT